MTGLAPAAGFDRAAYRTFLEAKQPIASQDGFEVDPSRLHAWLKPHIARAVVPWMLRGGRRAVFASFGLAKTSAQLEAGVQTLLEFPGERGLIVAPLGVRREFRKDARSVEVEERLGRPLTFIQSRSEIAGPGLYLTNYESVREGKIDLSGFIYSSLDEAAILRGFGGSKTFREFLNQAEPTPYRFVATATPSPNQYEELLAYAAYLGIMDVGQAKTRFFRRDSEHADRLTLYPHKEEEFWLWVASWSLWFDFPSDLGDFSDVGYVLPALDLHWHEVPVDHSDAPTEKGGQGVLFRNASMGVVEAARERRATMVARVAKVTELLAESPDDHAILWHDLEDERLLLEQCVPEVVCIHGGMKLDPREDLLDAFCRGWLKYLGAKASMLGAGGNLQAHCHRHVYCGVNSKFHDFIQSIYRLLRFGQTHVVRADIVYAESERGSVDNLKAKWRRHDQQRAKMRDIVRRYGLSNADMADALKRAMFDDKNRVEVIAAEPLPGHPDGSPPAYACVHNDTVVETALMRSDSVDLIVSSIPFGNQYEYSPNYDDLGHTDDAEHFWEHMGFLIPELLRVTRPGRVAAIHVKDRIVHGGMNGLGFQSVYPFSDDCRRHFQAAGWAFIGRITIVTDVVRENAQTYRLSHAEQLKDGTRQGCGLPEYVMLFRKPQTDGSKGYADDPVLKPRADYRDREGRIVPYERKREVAGEITPVPGTGYSRAKWQNDAHAFWRDAGDRLLTASEWASWDKLEDVYRLWKLFNLNSLYDFEHHVLVGETLHAMGKLPPAFMLLPPHSNHPSVWSDIAQMLSMNTLQCAGNAENHVCPMPFMTVDRLITRFSMPGELVFDPFGGLMTVPYRALKLGRRGRGHELNPGYFLDGCKYVEAMAREIATPGLFDMLGCKPGDPLTDDEAAHGVREVEVAA